MRVLHVTAYFAPAFGYGGPPRSILALCQATQVAGADIDVFTTTANNGRPLASAVDGVHFEGIRVRYFPVAPPHWLLGGSGLRTALAAAARNCDLLHIHGLWNRTVWEAAWVARHASRPYVLSPRGMLSPRARRHHRLRKLVAYGLMDRRVIRGAAALHASSDEEAAVLRQAAPGVPVIPIPNGVSIGAPAISNVRARLGLPAGVPLAVYIGRIHPIKRLDLLAEAARILRARGCEARLVIAGPDEAGTRRALERSFAGLDGVVHWVGELDQPVRTSLLREARVLMLCSDTESFGMAVAEALAEGCPVIATRTTPWSALADSGAGFWVEQQPVAIAAALERLVSSPALFASMSERARRYAERHLSLSATAAAMLNVYANVRAGTC